ncbi:class I SAM-dependent methyltransferase [Gorillibacterium sp. CAU 1737]|uniref:class I SAM-dependent methyltransferase n=1 Tax=Gorillibacterium sp. CAU 1737 TaxID=3140362 RepID=UPI003261530C
MGNTDQFDRIAERYDTPERIHVAKVSADAIRKYLVDAKTKHAIDFGCGTGLVGLDLATEFASVLFLDTSPNMIEQIKQKIADLSISNADTLCFDFEKESLPELHVDYIFMVQVLLHIPDIQPVLTRLFDVLKEGGHLLIVDFDKNDNIASDLVHNGFHQLELAGTLQEIGYQDIRSEVFYSADNLFMGQEASMFILDCRK